MNNTATSLFLPLLPLGQENDLTLAEVLALEPAVLAVDIFQVMARMNDTGHDSLPEFGLSLDSIITTACIPATKKPFTYKNSWNGVLMKFSPEHIAQIQTELKLTCHLQSTSAHNGQLALIHNQHHIGAACLAGEKLPSQQADKISYVMGVSSLMQCAALIEQGANWLQSMLPYQRAQEDILYTCDGLLHLAEPTLASHFVTIDKKCHCNTCQHYTLAYLHHLAVNRSLLGKRLTTVHNLAFWMRAITDLRNALETGTFATAVEHVKRYDHNGHNNKRYV